MKILKLIACVAVSGRQTAETDKLACLLALPRAKYLTCSFSHFFLHISSPSSTLLIMPLDNEYPSAERRLKRACEFDDSDVERAPTSKRRRLPTPSTSDHRLDQTLASPSIVPTQPKSAGSLKRFLEEIDPGCAPASKWPIHSWLETISPIHRIQSTPDWLIGQRTLVTADSDDYRRSFFEPLKGIPQSSPLDMPQSQGQIFGGASVASGRPHWRQNTERAEGICGCGNSEKADGKDIARRNIRNYTDGGQYRR